MRFYSLARGRALARVRVRVGVRVIARGRACRCRFSLQRRRPPKPSPSAGPIVPCLRGRRRVTFTLDGPGERRSNRRAFCRGSIYEPLQRALTRQPHIGRLQRFAARVDRKILEAHISAHLECFDGDVVEGD